jgi:hypothetical protein
MKKIIIQVGGVRLEAELFDTETAGDIYDALPLETGFNVWGDEFYFEIPVNRGLDSTATNQVSVGDIGYWPPGRALAVFFGPTPMSTSQEPVPASEVNLVGRVLGDAALFKGVKGEDIIKIYSI